MDITKKSCLQTFCFAFALWTTPVLATPVVVQNLDGDLSVLSLEGGASCDGDCGAATLDIVSTYGDEYNALGFRDADNWLYAVQLDATSTSNIPNTNSGIIGIDPGTGAITVVDATPEYTTDGGATTANMTTRIAAGDFGGDIMYIVEDDLDYGVTTDPGRYLYSADFGDAGVYEGIAAELVFDRVAITGEFYNQPEDAVFDYDYWDGYLWGADRDGDLVRLATDGTRTDFDVTGLPPSFNLFGGYGAVWVDDTIEDSLFVYINKVDANDGAIYRIDGIAASSTTAGDFSVGASWLAPNISWNDGTWIPADVPIVGVVPVPEPSIAYLFGVGLIGLAGISRKKFRR